jgi:hypothetical protein
VGHCDPIGNAIKKFLVRFKEMIEKTVVKEI